MSTTRFDSKLLQGKILAPGTNKKGEQYIRSLHVEPGYEELVNIVAGLQKDVKRINQCLTLEGATEWAAKKGPNWQAVEDDITGPNGKPDGIKEVFVTDSQGRLKVINGVSLEKTKYPLRKAYRTKNKTKEARKTEPYTQFIKNFTKISNEFDEDGNFLYENGAPGEFANVRPEITVKNAYKSLIFQPVYDGFKERLAGAGLSPMALAQTYNKSLTTCFNHHIRDPAIADVTGQNPATFDDKSIKKIMKGEDYKENAIRRFQSAFDEEALPNINAEVERIIDAVGREYIPQQ